MIGASLRHCGRIGRTTPMPPSDLWCTRRTFCTGRVTHKKCVIRKGRGKKGYANCSPLRSQYQPPSNLVKTTRSIHTKTTMNVSPNSNDPLAPCLRVAPLTPGKKRRESLTISIQPELEDEPEDAPVRIRHILRKSHSYDDAPQIPSRNGSSSASPQRPNTNRKNSLCSMTESRWSDSYHVMIDESPQRKFTVLSRESSTPVTPGTFRRSFTKLIRRPSSSLPEVVHVPILISDEDDLSDIEQP